MDKKISTLKVLSTRVRVKRREKRRIDNAGIMKYHGELYEVKGLSAADVYVFNSKIKGKLIVQCIETGEEFEPRLGFLGNDNCGH